MWFADQGSLTRQQRDHPDRLGNDPGNPPFFEVEHTSDVRTVSTARAWSDSCEATDRLIAVATTRHALRGRLS
jgi:hypothetical protein